MHTVPSMFAVWVRQRLGGPLMARQGLSVFKGAKGRLGWLHFTPYADE